MLPSSQMSFEKGIYSYKIPVVTLVTMGPGFRWVEADRTFNSGLTRRFTGPVLSFPREVVDEQDVNQPAQLSQQWYHSTDILLFLDADRGKNLDTDLALTFELYSSHDMNRWKPLSVTSRAVNRGVADSPAQHFEFGENYSTQKRDFSSV